MIIWHFFAQESINSQLPLLPCVCEVELPEAVMGRANLCALVTASPFITGGLTFLVK